MIQPTIEAGAHEFGLFWGGLDNRILRLIGLARSDGASLTWRIALHSGVAFVPIVVLCLVEGTAFGSARTIPLLHDVSVLVRLLFCVPLMLIAESAADHGTTRIVRYLHRGGLLREQAAHSLENLAAGVGKLGNLLLPELALIAIALLMIGVDFGATPGVSSWRQPVGGAGTTLAGYWLKWVSLPIYRFLLLRWLWRYSIWCWFLWRVSRLSLGLTATHPDQAGGLEFVATGQTNFGVLIVALSASVSSHMAQGMLLAKTHLASYYPNIAVFVVLEALFFLGPLCVFSTKLFCCKRRGAFEYGILGETYTDLFERQWINTPERTDVPLLGTADIQSMADLANTFNIVHGMRMSPFDKYDVLALITPAVVPFLPLLLLEYPVDELARRVLNLIL
jgi:hypothetical protein